MNTASTAYQAWDKRWATEAGRADWIVPEPFVNVRLPVLEQRGVRRVLDLGCGVGRHALALAEAGFDVCALDASPTGLVQGHQEARRRGLSIQWQEGLMHPLNWEDGSFDAVLSWNVIYHGTRDDTATVLREIRRMLRPQGLFVGSLLSKRDVRFGRGREISPDTYVIDGEEEKDHAHFYVDAAGVAGLLGDFHLLDLEQREQRTPGSWHWHLLAEKR